MDALAASPRQFRLDSAAVTLIIAIVEQVPVAVYWGPRLAADADDVLALAARGAANASPDVAAPLALTPQLGQGWPGQPGLAAHRDGRDWASFALFETGEESPSRLRLTSRDTAHGLLLTHDLQLDGDVLVATTRLDNLGDTALTVDHLAAPVLPIPADASRIIGLDGRWAGEFQMQALERQTGTWLRENRRGRTSHDAPPALFVTDATNDETQGRAWGWHLGWSGNHRLAVETLSDGRASVAMAALLLPGEARLAPGESLTSPPLYATVSDQGLGGVSRQLHAFLRARPEHARLRVKPRPVHYNSWEAVYFDHDPAVLMDLATRAAALGVERFVLDDGWFEGRRSDRAGLGDWRVDTQIYPDGLGPLIDHVRGLGMEFGLWVEPEMVNPDSALFRSQPDWVLGTPPAPQIGFRHQYVLDFSRAEVREHLYAAIAALLAAHPIAYLKWDMNRDISQAGGADGRVAAQAHVLGVYAVLDRLRADFPAVEIESCASGGGRADFGILSRTDRIWTSDSNDALDRLAIQRGFSLLFPAELMGSHVGPRRCHITGRVLSMPLRVATAMFGHLGLEMDLRELDDAEAADLAAGIALHKAWRPVIHSGDLYRIACETGVNAFLIAAADGSEALLSYTTITQPRGYFPATLRLAGLDPAAQYRLHCIWPPRLGDAAVLADGARVSGAALMQAGWQPPRLHPGTALVLSLTRE